MRPLADTQRVERFLEALGRVARSPSRRVGRIEASELLRLFQEIEPQLYRYPAIDPPTFRSGVEKFVGAFREVE